MKKTQTIKKIVDTFGRYFFYFACQHALICCITQNSLIVTKIHWFHLQANKTKCDTIFNCWCYWYCHLCTHSCFLCCVFLNKIAVIRNPWLCEFADWQKAWHKLVIFLVNGTHPNKVVHTHFFLIYISYYCVCNKK